MYLYSRYLIWKMIWDLPPGMLWWPVRKGLKLGRQLNVKLVCARPQSARQPSSSDRFKLCITFAWFNSWDASTLINIFIFKKFLTVFVAENLFLGYEKIMLIWELSCHMWHLWKNLSSGSLSFHKVLLDDMEICRWSWTAHFTFTYMIF